MALTAIQSKECTHCAVSQSVDCFYRNPLTKDGLGSWCKSCEKGRNRAGYVKEYCQTSSAKLAKQKYRLSRLGKSTTAKYGRMIRILNPEKARARDVVNGEVRAGRIVKPVTCERCGFKCKLQAHHSDYSQPLNVEWVCVTCHAKEHHG